MARLAALTLAILLASSPSVTLASAPSPAAQALVPAEEARELGWQIVSRRPHDASAWTQGLQFDSRRRLFESTGLYGRSSLREVDPLSGEVLRSTFLPEAEFGEGLAVVGDRLIQLTWKEGLATAWDPSTFEALETFSYEGQGWGLCHDGARLVMSDGSDTLTFRDADTFEVMGRVAVTLDGAPVTRLNELECVDGSVWANVWLTDHIVRIDPKEGVVTGILDLADLVHEQQRRGGDVLNGIAFDEDAGTYLVAGKLWSEMYEIRINDPMSR